MKGDDIALVWDKNHKSTHTYTIQVGSIILLYINKQECYKNLMTAHIYTKKNHLMWN